MSVVQSRSNERIIDFNVLQRHKALEGIGTISAERIEQLAKGFTPTEDVKNYGNGELIQAAIAYLSPGTKDRRAIPRTWPWTKEWWKPSRHSYERRQMNSQDRIKELAKAGALIAAEIDRLSHPQGRIGRITGRYFNGPPIK